MMKTRFALAACLGLAAMVFPSVLLAQFQGGEGPEYEWSQPLPPPDLGPAPFTPPPPPSGERLSGAAPGIQASPDLPPGLARALSIYSSSSQAPLPKSIVDGQGQGLIFNAGDVTALKEFRRRADLGNKLDWSVGDEIAGRGLEGDDEGRLTRLILEDGRLEGSLELAGAGSVIEVKSAGNAFVSVKLADLPLLTILSVTGSELRSLDKGAFASLPALSVLNLSFNKIDQINPETFNALSRLDSLNLSHNKLRYVDKRLLSKFSRLVDLNLAYNSISDFQRGVFEAAPWLISLNLAGNQIREVGEGTFQGLGRLESLNLSDNRIYRLSRGAFSGLKILKNLDLSGNRLTSFEAALLTGADKAAEVDLRRNCLPLSSLKNLRDTAPGGIYLRLGDQKDVYFSLRVQFLPRVGSFMVPARDAVIDGLASQVTVVGDENSGAEYIPPEKSGGAGRLIFKKSGLYRLKIRSGEAADDSGISAESGYILVVDKCPELSEAADMLGSLELAKALIGGLESKGFVEVPSADDSIVPAVMALFGQGRS